MSNLAIDWKSRWNRPEWKLVKLRSVQDEHRRGDVVNAETGAKRINVRLNNYGISGDAAIDRKRAVTRRQRLAKPPKPETFPGANEVLARVKKLARKLGKRVTKSSSAITRLFQSEIKKALTDLQRIPKAKRWMYEASHVVPVAESLNNRRERQCVDLNNAQLFPGKNFHFLFDKHLFSYTPKGEVVVSKELTAEIRELFGFDGRKIRRKPLTRAQDFYMAQHRAKVIG